MKELKTEDIISIMNHACDDKNLYECHIQQNCVICKAEKIYKFISEREYELQQCIEELEAQFAYECECNKELVATQEENKRLKTEIAKLKSEVNDYKQRYESSEKRYFESTQSGCEALRAKDEHFKKKVINIVGTIAKIMIEQFGDEPPCNFNCNDEYMWDSCNKFCEEYCNTPDNEMNYEKCWVEFLKSKIKDYGFEVEK